MCEALPVFTIHTHEPRKGLMKPSRVNEMSKQAEITNVSVKDATSAFLTGPGREGGRAAEHPQLSPDHARGKKNPQNTKNPRQGEGGHHRNSETSSGGAGGHLSIIIWSYGLD